MRLRWWAAVCTCAYYFAPKEIVARKQWRRIDYRCGFSLLSQSASEQVSVVEETDRDRQFFLVQ
jgi:hypothetical protein